MSNINPAALSSALNEISRAVAQVNTKVSTVEAQVGTVSRDLSTVTTELVALRQEFSEFVQIAERTANIQRSETKLSGLKDDLEREYGHYSLVRRSSIGTLQAFDIGNVSDKTVQQVSEELMIQTPRYWLAPALVALAAWSRDDASLSEKSVDAAFSRDRAKTSLFFALVLRRQGRLEPATRWLRHYFTSLNPHALTREFGVVLESVAQDAFGPAGRDLVLDNLVDWSTTLREDMTIVDEQIAQWDTEIAVLRGRVDDHLFPRLSQLSPQWDDARDVLEHASALAHMTQKYQAVLDAPLLVNSVLEDKMDDLLETLVTEYDEEELPLRREIVFHEAVLETRGDMVRARESADATVAALEDMLDAVTLVTHAALHPQLLGVGLATQKLAIGAGKSDFESATGRYTARYRAMHRPNVDIVLGPNHSNYATAMGFKKWTTSTDTPEEEASQSLSDAWDAVTADYIERVRFKSKAFVVPALLTVAAVLVFAFFGSFGGPNGGLIGGLLGLLVGGGISAIFLYSRKQRADAAVAAAVDGREAAEDVSEEIYKDAIAEWVDMEIAYREQDANEAGLLKLVASWPSINAIENRIAK